MSLNRVSNVVLLSETWKVGADVSERLIFEPFAQNMPSKTGDASDRMTLKTQNSTLSEERRMMSASTRSNGALAVGVAFDSSEVITEGR